MAAAPTGRRRPSAGSRAPHNPTRCAKLNGLIGSVIKMEVARRGQPSHAHTPPLTAEEYEHLIKHLDSVEVLQGAWLCAYFDFQ